MDRDESNQGKMLRELVNQFNTENNEENFYKLLLCLRDSNVWVPCNVVMSSTDENSFSTAKKGDVISINNDIRLVPDTLQNGSDSYFPVFSNREQMGDEYRGFSKVEKHFISAMNMTNSNSALIGIVLDAFSQPFVVNKELFDLIGNLPTSVNDEDYLDK